MYKYDEADRRFLTERVAQFRDQTSRYLAGKISDEEFLPMRLQNGVYVQIHAPMMRIAIPYGLLSSTQLRRLASITDKYDKSYGHFSTRQNMQINWPRIEDIPDILEELAEVEMHAVQTSGNCVRNITADPFAGVAPDEIADPRPWCELIRQWSTFHPEFAWLPRKFKIAVNASPDSDRAMAEIHDVGLCLVHRNGETGFRVLAGGGLGRTPVIGQWINEFVPAKHILTYLDAILRVYNLGGDRKHKYRARIKIQVKNLGAEKFRELVDAEWEHLKDGPGTLTEKEIDRVSRHFTPSAYKTNLDPQKAAEVLLGQMAEDAEFRQWSETNTFAHKVPGYSAVVLTLKNTGTAPGDASSDIMRIVADLADEFSLGELRVSQDQNLILPDVEIERLHDLWIQAREYGLAVPNAGMLTDMICCPGKDFCALAESHSIPVAKEIQQRFDDLDYLHDIGELDLKVAGCLNACSHYHTGHIGICGLDRKGEEFYKIKLGGDTGIRTRLGDNLGAGAPRDKIVDVVEEVIKTYIDNRVEGERFIDTYDRIGLKPFMERVYG